MKQLLSTVAGVVAACLLLCGGTAQAQPTISNVYPNGTNMFQPSGSLTFNANSGSGVTNIVVDLTGTNLYTGTIILSHLTSASGLTIVGSSVSAPLSANTLYGVAITVYDATGNVKNAVKFDTIIPVYTWEAEDFDHDTGLFFDTGHNQYANLSGVEGTDYHNGNPGNGNAAYRPKGLETENPNSGDSPLRLEYIGTTNSDYNVGWTSGGDWGNYSRHYPAGTYVMFVRAAGGNGPRTEAGDISIVAGTATSTNVGPYKYGIKGTGWGNYDFMPVTDISNKLVQFTFDGSTTTLRETQNNASDNFNFFMLLPVPTIVASTATIGNITPDGSVQFQSSNNLSFTVSSPVAINLGSVQVQLNATTLFGSNSLSALTIGNGLSYSGSSTSITVTAPLASNTVYSALILANDANGVQGSASAAFDTINPAYIFEGEDFNYGGGAYFDNPQLDAYHGSLHDGVLDVDFHKLSNTLGDYGRVGLNAENASDIHRSSYNIGGGVYTNDFDLGNTSGGDWGDYTRTFPAGTYNMFVRVSRGNGGSVTDAGKISLVTSDPTQTGQTIQDLGKHNTPSTGGWQTYTWMPILNSVGSPARFIADGTPKTLRYTFDGAGDNLGFVMLLPADLSVNPPPFASGFTPDGTGIFQPSNSITFDVNSSVGIPQANVHLNLNGVNVSGLSFSGSSTLWHVSYPVKTNALYTAIVTLTDTAGTTTSTNVFSTYDSGNYQWEAEDYDYVSGGIPGQYFDNPQVGSYAGTQGLSGTDMFESDPNGPGRGNHYRLATATDFPDDSSGDQARAQFIAASATDYNLGSFGIGSWANYTRHYPAGTYYVVGRFAEGAGPAGANLSLLTPGVSTNLLGQFNVANLGWGTWQWGQMVDGSGNPTKVTLNGSAAILRLGGTTGNEVNVNFLMLVATVPTPTLAATVSGGNIHISFPTQTGYSYQLQYKNNLTDATWTSLGGPISGNNAVQSGSDSTVGHSYRFYRVQIQ